MELKPGYKETDLGPLPSDWATPKLEEIGLVVNGLTYAPSDVRLYGTLVLRSSNIQDDVLAFEDNVFVDMEIPERIMVRPDDVLICVRNGSRNLIGKTALLDERTTGMAFGAFMAVFRSDHGRYVNYLFRSHIMKCQIDEHLGATINQITNKSLKSFHIPVPPTDHEIDAIATALRDVDALLDGLDRLIAKKRDLKQAAMQQLLSGETRLPGFEDAWRPVKFSDLTSPSHSRIDPNRSEPCNFCVELEHIEQGTGRLLGWSSTTPQSSLKAVFEPGDVLFGKLRAYLRKYWVADRSGVCSTEIWVLKPNPENVASGYLYQLVTTNWFIDAASTAYGTHMPRSDWKVIRELELQVPSPREQEAIAQVLGDMDAEIEALERRRAKTADLKQAMMQELLTGKTRLVEPQALDEQTDAASGNARGHNWAINEAVVIAALVKHFGKEDYPLGRKRYTKLSYLLHRRVERQAEGYLKKAAGPYNPQTKYGGPEKIAKQNGYIREHKGPKGHSGFVAADNIAQAEGYFNKWYGPEVIPWLEQFRYKKNDDLEVLATVDMAAEELRASGKKVTVATVKQVIASHPEWKAKLDRPAFSDANIAEAIKQSDALLGAELAGGSHA